MVGAEEGRRSGSNQRKTLRNKVLPIADGQPMVIRQAGNERQDTLTYAGRKVNQRALVLGSGKQLPLRAIADAYPDSRVVELKPDYQYGASQ